MTSTPTGYLHGFSKAEQDRLVKQAQFLEPSVYELVDLSQNKHLLELGCGVGAQTEILLRRYPNLKITAVDASPEQIEVAKVRLKKFVDTGQVTIHMGDASKLSFLSDSFDSVFVCWLLEHVEKPQEVLAEAFRLLAPGGKIYCSEVFNSTFYLHPYSPATLQYWFSFNDHQWNLKGDPYVGAKLGNYFTQAGFEKITTHVRTFFYDDRHTEQRKLFLEYWINLLLSGAPEMIKASVVKQELVDQMTAELEKVKSDPQSVFFYSWIQAQGFKK